MKRRYDIIVIGGGLVGGVFAALAARRGFDTLVVDRAPAPDMPVKPGLRVSALSSASRTLLQSIGAWPLLGPGLVCPYQHMRVWDGQSDPGDRQALRFSAREAGLKELGHIACNRAVQAAVFAANGALDNLTWQHDARITALAADARRASISLGENRLSAELLVAADGARSWAREQMQIPVRGGDYHQHAVVTHLSCDAGHGGTAWQRFLPSGPLALLPLADGGTSLVWSTTPDHAQQLCALDEADFCAAVTRESAGVIGTVTGCTQRATFPLKWLHAEEYTRPRFALIGDAAHAIHPLAGQGVNLGLLDAATLCDVIAQARDEQQEFAGQRVLRRYARWRSAENSAMLESLGALNALFANPAPVLASARRFGLGAVNRLTTVKARFLRHALGIAGDLPASLRKDAAAEGDA